MASANVSAGRAGHRLVGRPGMFDQEGTVLTSRGRPEAAPVICEDLRLPEQGNPLCGTEGTPVSRSILAKHIRRPAAYGTHYLALAEAPESQLWIADERLCDSARQVALRQASNATFARPGIDQPDRPEPRPDRDPECSFTLQRSGGSPAHPRRPLWDGWQSPRGERPPR